MSSGGMDWAYRMISAHKLDALGVAIVLHLGWRDAPDFRTDRGIARALCKDRASVRRATLKLEALGLLVRRSGQWVAAETVAIVEQSPVAPRPSASASDPSDMRGRGPQASGGLKPPGVGASSLRKRGPQASPMRKRKEEKGPLALFDDLKEVGRIARAEILAGRSALVSGVVVQPGSPQFVALSDLLRNGASCEVSR